MYDIGIEYLNGRASIHITYVMLHDPDVPDSLTKTIHHIKGQAISM